MFNLAYEIEKLNKRTTYEWEAFIKNNAEKWDDLTEGQKEMACLLAEKQGDRFQSFLETNGIIIKHD